MKKVLSILLVLSMSLLFCFTTNAQSLSENDNLRFEKFGNNVVETAEKLSLAGIKIVALENDIELDNKDVIAGKSLSIPLDKLKKDLLELKHEASVLNERINFSVEELKALKPLISEENYKSFDNLINELVKEIEIFNKKISEDEALINKLNK